MEVEGGNGKDTFLPTNSLVQHQTAKSLKKKRTIENIDVKNERCVEIPLSKNGLGHNGREASRPLTSKSF